MRELINIIEYAFIRAKGNLITEVDLPPYMLESREEDLNVPLSQSVSNNEITLILDTIQKCNGNKTRAASMLGISRKTLYNKLNKKKI